MNTSHPVLAYPRNIAPEEALNQETLDRLTAYLFSWEQGAGNIGGLHLHPCWGDSSVLTRRYQGQTTFHVTSWLRGMMRLFERTGDVSWRRQAADFVSNLLFLSKEGGFRHANFQLEPAYYATVTCPIHQGMPIHALLDYHEWEFAEPLLKGEIPGAVERHWKWFQKVFWRKGNEQGALPHPGWCGVTNQDLVIVGALARRAKIFGETELYREFGQPVLDVYLAADRYHEAFGLFERGFRPGLVERTFYSGIMLEMFQAVADHTRDPRLSRVIDNVSGHLFDALFVGEDGRTHLAWGADVEGGVLKGWTHGPIPIPAYPVVLPWMEAHLRKFPDKDKERQRAELERTLAAYVFADGTIPTALQSGNPILSLVPGSENVHFWAFLVDRLGERVRLPDRSKFVPVHRAFGDLEWKSAASVWRLERQGKPLFTGFKPNPSGIALDGEDLFHPDPSRHTIFGVQLTRDPEELAREKLAGLHDPAYVERVGAAPLAAAPAAGRRREPARV